jgi:hypothetical protein
MAAIVARGSASAAGQAGDKVDGHRKYDGAQEKRNQCVREDGSAHPSCGQISVGYLVGHADCESQISEIGVTGTIGALVKVNRGQFEFLPDVVQHRVPERVRRVNGQPGGNHAQAPTNNAVTIPIAVATPIRIVTPRVNHRAIRPVPMVRKRYNLYTFEFDPVKSKANRLKHGIDFVCAQAIWRDGDWSDLVSVGRLL